MGFLLICALIWLVALVWAWQRHSAISRSTGTSVNSSANSSHDLYRDLLAGGALVIATLAFFWRMVSGDVYQPADGGDLVSFLFPTYRFAAAEMARGALPLWNPTLYGGAPFISDIQAGFLYLPNLLLFLIQPNFGYTTMQWLVLGHITWAGLGMYLLLRTLRWPRTPLSRPAALFGALAFMFCDPLLVHLGNLNLIAVLSWLPWLLAAYSRGFATGRWVWFGVAAILFALANYAGHPQSTLYLGIALAVQTLGWVLQQWGSKADEAGEARSALITGAVGLGATVLLAVLLSAPILLPALELTAYTERSTFTYQDTTTFSLAPTQLIGLLTPGFFGRGPALHWSLWDRVETPYAGVATLLLALGALLMAPADLRRRLWPWVGLAGVGMATSLGVYAIFHGWLTLLVPGLAQMRAPARALILWNTGLAVVAAVGVDLLLHQGQDALAGTGGSHWRDLLRRGAQIGLGIILPLGYLTLFLTQDNETAFLRASVALLALVLALLWWLATWAVVAGLRALWWSGSVAVLLLISLLFFDLSAAGAYTDISPDDPTVGFDHPAIVEFLRADPDPFRIDSRTDIQDRWQPDTAALYGFEDVGGIVNPLALSHWQALWEATGGRGTRLYDMLNVKYVIVRDGTPLPEGKFELALDAPGDLAIYSNSNFMPRAWVVHEARLASDVANALSQIQAPDFDPFKTVIVLDNEELASVTPYGPLQEGAAQSQATFTQLNSNNFTIQVDSSAPGLLVLSELWYPGWQATVNGTSQQVIHANGSLRAVPIPAGESIVELSFRPSGWRWGQILAGLGILALVAIFWAERRRRPADTVASEQGQNIDR